MNVLLKLLKLSCYGVVVLALCYMFLAIFMPLFGVTVVPFSSSYHMSGFRLTMGGDLRILLIWLGAVAFGIGGHLIPGAKR